MKIQNFQHPQKMHKNNHFYVYLFLTPLMKKT
jgi:hypothetical protein